MAVLEGSRKFRALKDILDRHEYNPEALIEILQSVQEEYRYLPEDVMMHTATALDLPPAAVYGVATFYEQFSTEPRGRYVLKVCDGTACHISGSPEILEALQKEIGIEGSRTTSRDMLFTLERVACVGACGLAPVVVVNDDETYGGMTPDKVADLIAELRSRPAEGDPPPDGDGEVYTETTSCGFTLGDRHEFHETAGTLRAAIRGQHRRVLVCMGTPCMANGADMVYDAIRTQAQERGLDIAVVPESCGKEVPGSHPVGIAGTGCMGLCQEGPLVRIEPEGTLYCNVKPGDAEAIVEETLREGRVLEELLYEDPADGSRTRTEEGNPFYKTQEKLVLSTCGTIASDSIFEYMAFDGYASLVKALFDMTPEQVVEEVRGSGLRGRGGAGFPTGLKWSFTAREEGERKYVVCNGDEGDPGAFMDRCIMEGDPHRLLEGLLIAGYAVGASQGYIYVRAEYPLAVKRLSGAVDQAREMGLIGRDILGSGFGFNVEIREGAGAFVCGEETSLLASIEGQRGIPRPRPPYPAQSGLWSRPTLINNVETLANVPCILTMGSDEYQKLGQNGTPGTKTFALAGHVARTGLVEIPFGITLRELVFDIGGGMKDGSRFKAIQIGGPSGGCLPASELDRPLDYESIREAGAIIGSGGLIVMDTGTCMVEVARFFLDFIQDESCGKCVPCREGTRQMLLLLDRIQAGQAAIGDLDLLEHLAHTVEESALCGLGKTAPNPVLSSLRYFRDEYIEHIRDKRCSAGQCSALLGYRIRDEECVGCGRCQSACPQDAIAERTENGTKGKGAGYAIDPSACDHCGMCADECPVDAITAE